MIAALPPSAEEEQGYAWDAVTARLAPHVAWSSIAQDVDGNLRRTGHLSARGAGAQVVVIGNATRVTSLEIGTQAIHALALLNALRAAGANVDFESDYETYSEYIVTPPGRDFARLSTSATCSPFEQPPRADCRYSATLLFNPY